MVRVVLLKFHSDQVKDALDKLNSIAPKVRAQRGCKFLEISQGFHDKSEIITYSYWESQNDLNVYRQSDFFRAFWKDIRVNFQEPARAWSVESCVRLN